MHNLIYYDYEIENISYVNTPESVLHRNCHNDLFLHYMNV